MAIRRHWLEAVEDVLRASTGDFKALAEIAEADPKVLYIGTKMDGADLRGQDLRGVRFTHLDLSKVQRDEKTILDADLDISFPSARPAEGPAALVFLQDFRRPPRFDHSKDRPFARYTVFYPDQEREFREACAKFRGPKFVIFEHNKKRGLTDRILKFGAQTIMVVSRPASAGQIAEDGHSLISEGRRVEAGIESPILIVPYTSMPGLSQHLMSGPVLDALVLCERNWDVMLPLLQGQRVSAFLRGLGVRPDSDRDAWCRVLSLAVRSGVLGNYGVRLHSSETLYSDIEKFSAALFGDLPSIRVEMGERRPTASVLIDLTRDYRNPDEAYASAVRRLLLHQGWKLKAIQARGFNDGEFKIESATMNMNVAVAPSRFLVDARAKMPDIRVERFDFSAVREIVAMERPNERVVVNGLIERNILYVTAGDLRGFFPKGGSIWTLVGHQISRMARVSDQFGRTQYLSMVLRYALRRDRVHNGDTAHLIDVLNEHDFADRFALTPKRITLVGRAMSFNMEVAQLPTWAYSRPIIRFRLLIDEDGPILTDLSSVWPDGS